MKIIYDGKIDSKPEIVIKLHNEFYLLCWPRYGVFNTTSQRMNYGTINFNGWLISVKEKLIHNYLINSNAIQTDILKEQDALIENIHNLQPDKKLDIGIEIMLQGAPRKEMISRIETLFPFYSVQERINSNIPTIELYDIISTWVHNTLMITENVRYHKAENRIPDDFEYKGIQIVSGYLPAILYNMKNSIEAYNRDRYKEILETFQELTEHEFDVVHNFSSQPKMIEGAYYITQENIKNPLHADTIYGTLTIFVTSRNNKMISTQHSIEFCGAGLFELLYFLTVTIGNSQRATFLDEPAANLHPSWQDSIKSKIIKYAKNTQFIVITHSPFMLPDFKKGEGISLWYFNKSIEEKTRYNPIKVQDEKTRRILDKNKRTLFNSMNIIVEGPSDEWILKEMVSRAGKTFSNFSIEFISGGGDGAILLYEQLSQWGLPTAVILDHDKKEEYLKRWPERNPNVLLLPSDIEGTIVLGDFLEEIRSIIGEKQYQPHMSIEKFGSNRLNKARYKDSDIIKAFDNDNQIKKSYNEVRNALNGFSSKENNPINISDIIKEFNVGMDTEETVEKLLGSLIITDSEEEMKTIVDKILAQEARMKKLIIENILPRLNYYKEKDYQNSGKERRAVDMTMEVSNPIIDFIPKTIEGFINSLTKEDRNDKVK